MSFLASSTVGSAGMAPFCVVHIAPQAFENVKASFSFSSFFDDEFNKAKTISTIQKKRVNKA